MEADEGGWKTANGSRAQHQRLGIRPAVYSPTYLPRTTTHSYRPAGPHILTDYTLAIPLENPEAGNENVTLNVTVNSILRLWRSKSMTYVPLPPNYRKSGFCETETETTTAGVPLTARNKPITQDYSPMSTKPFFLTYVKRETDVGKKNYLSVHMLFANRPADTVSSLPSDRRVTG